MSFKQLPYFRRVKWNPDAAELRSFAIAMLIGFAVLGGLSVLRHHEITKISIGLWTTGLILTVAALIRGINRWAYLAVYVPSSFIGHFVSKVVLFVVFFLVFAPLGVLLRLLGKDLLRIRPGKPRAAWSPMNSTRVSSRYYRQF